MSSSASRGDAARTILSSADGPVGLTLMRQGSDLEDWGLRPACVGSPGRPRLCADGQASGGTRARELAGL